MNQPTSRRRQGKSSQADVVCFGMITPAIVVAVDQFPEHNTGVLIREVAEFVSDDAAIVACLLRGWNVKSGLIGTKLGDDPRGRETVRRLRKLGVQATIRLSKRMTTPFEVNISDGMGHRTYFWQREPRVLKTLSTASLSMVRHAKILYVDWYDGSDILRPMKAARRLGIPVFLNLEHGHSDPQVLSLYAPYADICQAITDPAQRGGDPVSIARRILDAGVETCLVTLASGGCLASRRGEFLRAVPPTMSVIDGCGAGATFSAGILYGYLQQWELEEMIPFATAAASLKCTVVGPRAFPIARIKRFAKEVKVVRIRD